MAHRHHAASERTVGWSHCIAPPSACCSGAAHGGVVDIETCECGATRRTESNGRHSVRGKWVEAEQAAWLHAGEED